MKFKPDKKQITWAVTAFLTVVAILFVYYLMFHGSRIGDGFVKLVNMMSAVLWGVVIALIITPMLNGIENKWLKPHGRKKGIDLSQPNGSKEWRSMRRLSIFLTETIFIAILVVLTIIIAPQIVSSIGNIAENFQGYVNNAQKSIEKLLSSDYSQNIDEQTASSIESLFGDASSKISSYLSNTVMPNLDKVVRTVSSSLYQTVKGIFNFIVGIIVSIYLLYSKEKLAGQFKKLAYSLFKEENANEVIGAFRNINRTFVGFINGKLLDSLIIGILCYIGTTIIGTPYANLVSVVVGVTNIIPFFGPYIGAIFGVALVIFIDPLQALYFLIFVIILQQFDGNILGPKILGDSTGLSSFWVIFSILLFGGLFGLAGWIIGVPLFAVLYAWVSHRTERKLIKKNLPTDTQKYMNCAYIEQGQIHMFDGSADQKYVARKLDSPWTIFFRTDKKKEQKPAAAQQHTEIEQQENRTSDTKGETDGKDNDLT
jgi:predicted PurR-regulated permease PerM